MRYLTAAPILLLAACQTNVYGDGPGMTPPSEKPVVCNTPDACKGGTSISADTMKRLTQTLSSDAFEGRAPGGPGEQKTLDLLTSEFQKLGLKPGNNGSWFQDVPLVEISAKNVSALSFTGGKATVSSAYGPEMVIGTYRVTPRIEVKDSPMVFVGYGINAPERGWNDYAGLDVKGKTVGLS